MQLVGWVTLAPLVYRRWITFWRILDATVSDECNFTEKIWRLPETRLCFTPPALNIGVQTPSLGQWVYVTFGCFNNLTKMVEPVVALWAAWY